MKIINFFSLISLTSLLVDQGYSSLVYSDVNLTNDKILINKAYAELSDYEVWVTNQGLDKIQILKIRDSETLEPVAEIEIDGDGKPASSKPHMIFFDSATKYAYVANVGAGAVTIIDVSKKEIVTTIPTGNGAHAAVPSPDDKRVYVVNMRDATITEILTDTEKGIFTVGRTIKVSEMMPLCAVFTNDSKKAYISAMGNLTASDPMSTGLMSIIDVESGKEIKTIGPLGKNGCGLFLSEDGSKLFANVGTPVNKYYVIDTSTDEIISSASLTGNDAHGVYVVNDEVWILNRQSNSVDIIDADSYSILSTLSDLPDKPDLLSLSPDKKLLFMTLRGQAVTGDPHALSGIEPGVAIIDVAQKKVITKMNLGGDAHGIAVTPEFPLALLPFIAGFGALMLVLGLRGRLYTNYTN
ncbi:MAG: YncE family protein [Nitrosopumilaceae archaeon]